MTQRGAVYTASTGAEQRYWSLHREFGRRFGNPDFPRMFDGQQQVRFLGVWDTVKAIGWLNYLVGVEPTWWPFTRRIDNVHTARHALAIDERRRQYREERFMEMMVAESDGRYQEMWFAGAHSDVGGRFDDDHSLSDIALSWMVKEAYSAGFLVDEQRYSAQLGCGFGEELPVERALGRIAPHRQGMVVGRGLADAPDPAR